MVRPADFRVFQTIASVRADHGGPSRSVTALCAALARQALEVHLISSGMRPGEEPPLVPRGDGVRTELVEAGGGIGAWFGLRHPIGGALARAGIGESRRAIVHDHGVWLGSNHAVAVAARRERVARIVSPRGMLSTWALRHHAWKKRVAWATYQARDLAAARLIHVTSDAEADEVRALGLRQPIAVIANGVDLPATVSRTPRGAAPRRALFLSRIHPKKGLINLVIAWARVRPVNWTLVIAGPDDGGHRKTVEARATEEGISGNVEFTGSVADAHKWEMYANADLFVLPTHSENFGIVIAEALAAELPVITTKAAPWRGIAQHRCGWWIDLGVEPLAAALGEATAMSDDERRTLGRRGRAYVADAFSWDRAAADMRDVYAWTLGGGTPPAALFPD